MFKLAYHCVVLTECLNWHIIMLFVTEYLNLRIIVFSMTECFKVAYHYVVCD